MDTARLIESLRDPRAFPGAADRVEVLQTHISVLFFTQDRVYKVKKPVDLGFVDFTDPKRREHFCHEEVRLNRRLTPWMYLGVVPIVAGPGDSLRVDSQGEAVEWAVAMERLPEERMLASMLERGEVDNAMMDELVRVLVGFHRDAPAGAGVEEYGTPATITRNVDENFEQIQPFVGQVEGAAPSGIRTLSPSLLAFLELRARTFLEEERELLERRVHEGRVRDGHGDLHAGNICFSPRGIAIYDCIEFEPRFRCGDVACDLAFLAMDLDYRGFAGFGGYLLHRYAELAEDPELSRLIRFYKGYRAVVRGKVGSLSALDETIPDARRRELAREAMRYFQLAAAYELPPALVLMCGLPGCGKTWLAERLARPMHAIHVKSDVRRKTLAGAVSGAKGEYGTGLYSQDRKDRTYRSLLESAVKGLEEGRSVIVDATFSRREWRLPFVDAAARLGHPFYVVHCESDDQTIRRRLEKRAQDRREASEADWEVYQHAKQDFEPPEEVPAGHTLVVDSAKEDPESAVLRLTDRMIALSAR